MTKAYCPLALSFIFKAELPPSTISDWSNFGSTGIGCTIDRKVTVTAVRSDKNLVLFNSAEIQLPTVTTALNILTEMPFLISIESPLPLAHGFGVSGASTLASLYAVNNLLKLEKRKKTLAQIAHFSEIKNKTGLGTVATQIIGGFLIKKKPGVMPVLEKLNFTGKKIYATVVGSLKTKTILSDSGKLKKINTFADRALSEIMNKKKITLYDILNISHRYCFESGLLTNSKTIEIIEKVRQTGGAATMAILGQTVLSNVKPPGLFKYKTYELTISQDKAKV